MDAHDNATPNELEVQYKAKGKGGKIQMWIKWPGGSFTDTINVLNAIARKRFTNGLLQRHPGLDPADIESSLDRIAAEIAGTSMAGKVGADEDEKEQLGGSDDEILIQLGRDKKRVELFHSGVDATAEAYARIRRDGFFVVYPIRSRAYSMWLRNEFFQRLDRSPTAEAFTSAINTLEAAALYRGERVNVYLRVAPFEGGVAIDLCNDDWSVVLVTASGWKVVSSEASPVRFMRRRGMLPLPVPIPGGSIDELRPFVNIPSGDGWVLYVCALTSALSPRGPYVVLSFSGEQGSAKSTTVKRSRALTDPNEAPVRRMPHDDRDLMIAANNSHVQAFDNLSHIPPHMSDALCSLATGGGYATRQLFTDSEETLFNSIRPVFMNGIEDVATRPDLLDRCVLLALPPITETKRREEKEMDEAFERARPRILGALLDGVSTALRRFDSVKLERKPRMADFARWCAAAEVSFGFAEGTFLSAYQRNRNDAVAIALESAIIYAPLYQFVIENEEWTGTATELLRQLEKLLADPKTKDRREWPKHGKAMAEALKRIAPALRSVGIEIVTGERTTDSKRTRLVTLSRCRSDGPDESDDVPGESGGRDTRDEKTDPDEGSRHHPPYAPETPSGSSEPSGANPEIDSAGLNDAAAHEAAMDTGESDEGDAWRVAFDNKEPWS